MATGLSTALTVGSRGPDVQKVQQALNKTLGEHIGTDGVFGPATAAAVRQFQQRAGLSVDGIVGETTWAKLFPSVQPAPAPGSPVFCLVQHCPVFNDIGPYIAILAADAKATINSIYRGADAEALLNKYGHLSQRQLYAGFVEHKPGFNPANPPGFSTHELHSDGAAYPNVPRGNRLPWWGQGFDVNDSDIGPVTSTASKYGWQVWRPYPSGAEYHHLNFRAAPSPGGQEARINQLRQTLPRS